MVTRSRKAPLSTALIYLALCALCTLSITEAARPKFEVHGSEYGDSPPPTPTPSPSPSPVKPRFVLDGSLVATLMLATLVLILGGLRTRRQTKKDLLRRMEKERALLSSDDAQRLQQQEDEPVTVLNEKLALFMVVQATVGLLVLYFLLSKVFFIVILVFYTLLSTMAVSAQFSLLLDYLRESWREWAPSFTQFCTKTYTLPLLGQCPASELLSIAVGLVVAVTWACIRMTSWWSWVLQDISGVCIILTILMFLKLPNLKIACILLPLIMFYDVFFVYIQPMLFHNESVMKKVATGGSTHEVLPMVLLIPNFEDPEAFSMLGYGDIALPGLLLMYAATFDEVERLPWIKSYFVLEIVGYVMGLILTIGALALDIGGQQGQPALLYLIPCTLLPILLTSYWRGHLEAMFRDNLIIFQPLLGNSNRAHGGTSSGLLLGEQEEGDRGDQELLLATEN